MNKIKITNHISKEYRYFISVCIMYVCIVYFICVYHVYTRCLKEDSLDWQAVDTLATVLSWPRPLEDSCLAAEIVVIGHRNLLQSQNYMSKKNKLHYNQDKIIFKIMLTAKCVS